MTNKIPLKGGTPWSDGDILYAADLNDSFESLYSKLYADNTGGSIASSITETDLATITIPQNTFGSSFNVLVSSGIGSKGTNSSKTNHYLKLYINGSTVKTVNLVTQASGGGDDFNGSAITYLATGLDSTAGDIIVKVTGQNSASSSLEICYCYGLTVTGTENNS